MLELAPLEKIERLEGLETTLKPLFEKDTKKYYSNLELVCISTDLLYQSHLQLEQIAQKRNTGILTLYEYNRLNIESNKLTKQAIAYLITNDKNFIYWNDEDIQEEFKNSMLGNVEEC